MGRNRWETAIRCLEVALHLHTSDDEVVAGVNGFRRTADGTPLSEICREFGGANPADREAPQTTQKLERLSRENRDLRRKLEAQREDQVAALRRLEEATRAITSLSAEIDKEKQSFADFRAASARIVDGLKDENFDLRDALEQASRGLAARPASAFSDFLTAARRGDHVALTSETALAPHPRHPWTA